MMRFRRLWNHRPDANRYIRGVSRLDCGIIASVGYCDLLLRWTRAAPYNPMRAATFVHDGKNVTLNDSVWDFFDRDPTMSVAQPSGIVVLQQAFPSVHDVNKVAARNPRRIFWLKVRRSRGLVIRREITRNHAMLSVSESNLEAVLTALVSIVARRRSRPTRNCTGLFTAAISGLGSRSPAPMFFGLGKRETM